MIFSRIILVFSTCAIFGVLSGCPEPIQYQMEGPSDTKHMVQLQYEDNGVVHKFWIDAFEFPNRPQSRPRANNSFREAMQACAEHGKRLCTAREWRHACLGKQKLRFGYGAEYEDGRCHTATDVSSGHSSLLHAEEMLVDSGKKEHCQTDGVFDVIGNLEEWVLDDWQGREGSLEGGAWYTYSAYADCSGSYSRQPDYRLSTEHKVFSAGFRCCWSATPPSKEDIAADSKLRIQPKTQTSSVQYDASNEVPISSTTWMDRFEYPNIAGVYPKTNVSWTEANTLCQEHGKRLCDAQEWEQACAPNAWQYPTGTTFIEQLCSVGLSSATKIGEHWACVSLSGAQDMVGSVWEWTSNSVVAPVLQQDPTSISYEIRGGSWFTDERKAVCHPDDGYPVADKHSRYPDVGFRCCRGDNVAIENTTKAMHTCPHNMIAMSTNGINFCIDKYEYPNVYNATPVYDSNLAEAQSTCAQEGKHLCTDTEWLTACTENQSNRWAYGNQYTAGNCNDHSQENSSVQQADASGSFPDCKTPSGVMDMTGNLWEWTSVDNTTGKIRGGGWNISAGLGQCRGSSNPHPTFHSADIGFRCCANVEEIKRLQ